MSSKIYLKVIGTSFNIEVNEDFASFLQTQIQNDFDEKPNNSLKDIVDAYMKKSYELYVLEKKLNKVLEKLP